MMGKIQFNFLLRCYRNEAELNWQRERGVRGKKCRTFQLQFHSRNVRWLSLKSHLFTTQTIFVRWKRRSPKYDGNCSMLLIFLLFFSFIARVCQPQDVTLHLKAGSYPVISPENITFPKHFLSAEQRFVIIYWWAFIDSSRTVLLLILSFIKH